MASSKQKQRPSNRPGRMAAAQQAQRRRQLMSWLGTGIVTAIVAVAALIVLNDYLGDDDESSGVGGVATVVAGQSIDASIPQNGMVLGNPDAPVTIVEYGDYQCPFCVRFKRQDMETLIQEYIQTGKVRFEYHEYPIIGGNDPDGESFLAAEAAYCANDQGQYWPYHNALYANSLGEFVGSFTPERLKEIATRVPGLDLETFNTCVDNRTHTDTVQQSANAAITAGINSTPSFMINGTLVRGADYAAIKDAIEQQLAEE